MGHWPEVVVGSEQYEVVTKRDDRNECIDGLELPALASERALKRGGVLRIGFVGDVTRKAGAELRPLGKILRGAREQADSIERLGHDRNRDREGIACLKAHQNALAQRMSQGDQR